MKDYKLTDDEAVLLDGRVNPEAQASIDIAKQRIAGRDIFPELNEGERAFVIDVQIEARSKGELCKRFSRMTMCPGCGDKRRYAVHKRSSMNHRKGAPNYNKPIDVCGISLACDFITIQSYPRLAVCTTCFAKLKPYVDKAIADIPCQYPEALFGHPSPWMRYENRHCTACNWEGHEGQMGLLPAMLSGHYRGQCPQCKARNEPLGKAIIESKPGHVLVKMTIPEANKPQTLTESEA